MKNKVFFQLVALVALAVTVVFLFMRKDKTNEIIITGVVFVLATILSLVTGDRAGGATDGKD
jgi:hypothetical protein